MKQDVHSQSVPQQAIDAAEAAIEAQLLAFKPYSTPLTPEERVAMLKLGPAAAQFTQTALVLAKKKPDLASKSFDAAAFARDLADVAALAALENLAQEFLETIRDIIMTAGSEAYRAALEFYADAKTAAERDVPEARAVYEDLRNLYPNRKPRHRSREEPDASGARP